MPTTINITSDKPNATFVIYECPLGLLRISNEVEFPESYWSIFVQRNRIAAEHIIIMVAQDRIKLSEVSCPDGDQLYTCDRFTLEVFGSDQGEVIAKLHTKK